MVTTYTYDVFGQRIQQDQWQTGVGTPTLRFAWSGNQIWADMDSMNTLVTRYLYGDNTDQLLAREASATAAWTLADRLGSVRDVINSAGTVLDHIDYSGFGVIKSETSSANRGRFAWTGREYDSLTGLQNNRARYYSPSGGKWWSEDPSGFGAGDTNLNRYVGNDAPNATDPTGLADIPEIEKIEKGKAGPDKIKVNEAIIKTLVNAMNLSNESNKDIVQRYEYGGFIIQSKEGKIIPRDPKTTKSTTSVDLNKLLGFPRPIDGETMYGDYHTHPKHDKNPETTFSSGDLIQMAYNSGNQDKTFVALEKFQPMRRYLFFLITDEKIFIARVYDPEKAIKAFPPPKDGTDKAMEEAKMFVTQKITDEYDEMVKNEKVKGGFFANFDLAVARLASRVGFDMYVIDKVDGKFGTEARKMGEK
jgi:RHS repeat-associated protein